MLPDNASKGLRAILAEIDAQSDRGAAIIAAAIVEDALAAALGTRLILTSNLSDRIFSHEKNGPLANFSAKIDLATAVGLITKQMCDEFHIIRRIRNKFAHTIEPITFSDPKISDWCTTLKTPGNVVANFDKIKIGNKSDTRSKFTLYTTFAAALLLAATEVTKMKIEPFNFPRWDNAGDQEILGQFIVGALKVVERFVKP